MSSLTMSRAALAALSVACAGGASAQSPVASDGPDLQLFLTERLWNARWDHRIVDAFITAPPTPGSPPEATITVRQRTATKLVPVHSVGLRYQGLVVSASAWSADFDFGGFTATGRSKRREFDVTVSHALTPGVTASLTYKHGKVDSAVTPRAATLLGLTGRQKGDGLLLGLSATAPLSPQLFLYGNFAYGAGKYQVAEELTGNPEASIRYTIGEFGAAYRLDAPGGLRAVDSVTLQLGYRFQAVAFRSVGIAVPTSGAVKFVAPSEGKPQTTTEGLALSVSLAF